MSRAFVKESDGDAREDIVERPVSAHPNFVTPQGFAAIEQELARLDNTHTSAVQSGDAGAIARVERDLRYWRARRVSAEIVNPPKNPQRVVFGAVVTVGRGQRPPQTFRIVGEDEAEPAKGTLSHAAPLARALFGKSVGDVLEIAGATVEILKIEE